MYSRREINHRNKQKLAELKAALNKQPEPKPPKDDLYVKTDVYHPHNDPAVLFNIPRMLVIENK